MLSLKEEVEMGSVKDLIVLEEPQRDRSGRG